jgi:hypothetical protein
VQWISHIAYSIGDAVRQDYQQTHLHEKRRRMMVDWAEFLDKSSQKKSTKIAPIRRAK